MSLFLYACCFTTLRATSSIKAFDVKASVDWTMARPVRALSLVFASGELEPN